LNYYLLRPASFATRTTGEFQDVMWDEAELEMLVAEAQRSRPEMSRLRVSERSAAEMLQLAKAESRFRADFSTEYGIMSRLPDNLFNSKFARWNFGVNFTLPLFDGFRRSGMVYQATANQRAVRLQREDLSQRIRLNVEQALDEVQATRETIEAAKVNITQAQRVLEMMQTNYQYGAATTLDIVDAQTALSLARNNLLRGQYEYSIARANLRWVLGRTPWE
jgi:outer membrane protein